MRTLGLGLVIVVGLALVGVRSASAGGQDTLTIGSLNMRVGDEGNVMVHANIAAPGLGAWSFDVIRDPNVISTVACDGAEFGVCGPSFSSNSDRVSGARSQLLEGEATLAHFSFRCDREGESRLSIVATNWGSAIPEDPSRNLEVVDGSVTCVAGSTGNGGGTLSIDSVTVGLGEEAKVDVSAAGVGRIGAWKVDVLYDSALVTLVDCVGGEGTTCITDDASTSLRLRGASADELEGDFRLATLTLRCDAVGTSAWSLDASVWSAPTIADISVDPPIPPEISNGSIVCGSTPTVILPPTGRASKGPGSDSPFATLAALGVVALLAGAAIAWRRA
jgi:hypothetical protein